MVHAAWEDKLVLAELAAAAVVVVAVAHALEVAVVVEVAVVAGAAAVVALVAKAVAAVESAVVADCRFQSNDHCADDIALAEYVPKTAPKVQCDVSVLGCPLAAHKASSSLFRCFVFCVLCD